MGGPTVWARCGRLRPSTPPETATVNTVDLICQNRSRGRATSAITGSDADRRHHRSFAGAAVVEQHRRARLQWLSGFLGINHPFADGTPDCPSASRYQPAGIIYDDNELHVTLQRQLDCDRLSVLTLDAQVYNNIAKVPNGSYTELRVSSNTKGLHRTGRSYGRCAHQQLAAG
jgi:hypothetical protein